MEQDEYQKQYDAAAAELEAAANPTTARDDKGQFAKATPEATPEKPEPETPEVKPEPEVKAEPDPLEEIRQKLEKTEKALKDTQAWGTKNAQALAQIQREAEERKRAAERPAILDANPELEEAIKYVRPEPVNHDAEIGQAWNMAVHTAHPGIFDKSIDPELERAILARFDAVPEARTDPLIAIREITAEKLAFTERQLGKRFASESQKAAQKSAMSVPGAGASGAKTPPPDADLAEKNRILNMTDAEFAKEVRKVKGY
jgi:hypothetical protein